MTDERFPDALKRAKTVVKDWDGEEVSTPLLKRIVAQVLQDGTDHDPTRFGRHLAQATEAPTKCITRDNFTCRDPRNCHRRGCVWS